MLAYKKTIFLILAVFCLTACGSSSNDNPSNSTGNEGVKGWKISVLDSKVNDSLENISTSVGYGGGTSTSKVTKKPAEGKTFLLVKLLAEKEEGTAVINWNNLKVMDSSGKFYSRMEDNFLEDEGFKRMRGTSLNFGTNEGWIAFEVDKGDKDLYLKYSSADGSISTKLNK